MYVRDAVENDIGTHFQSSTLLDSTRVSRDLEEDGEVSQRRSVPQCWCVQFHDRAAERFEGIAQTLDIDFLVSAFYFRTFSLVARSLLEISARS